MVRVLFEGGEPGLHALVGVLSDEGLDVHYRPCTTTPGSVIRIVLYVAGCAGPGVGYDRYFAAVTAIRRNRMRFPDTKARLAIDAHDSWLKIRARPVCRGHG